MLISIQIEKILSKHSMVKKYILYILVAPY